MYLFYAPNIAVEPVLPEEESGHCVRVLRYSVGDEILITDGRGTTYTSRITNPHPKHCDFEIISREKQEAEAAAEARERKLQKATLAIQGKYGKNALLKGMNFLEGATTKERNQQIGGHRSGEKAFNNRSAPAKAEKMAEPEEEFKTDATAAAPEESW